MFARFLTLPAKLTGQFNRQLCDLLPGRSAGFFLGGLFSSLFPSSWPFTQRHRYRAILFRQCSFNTSAPPNTLKRMSSLAQESAFLTRKASPNILVHFHSPAALAKNDERLLLEKLNHAIEAIYGRDRFIVYCIKEAELKFDSKIYSASAVLVVGNKQGPESANQTAFHVNIPLLYLDLQRLCPEGHFDFDYFSRQIQTCISVNQHPVPCQQVNQLDGPCSQKILFAADATYENWSQICRSKGINLIECLEGADLPQSASQHDVLFFYCRQKPATQAGKLNGHFNAAHYFAELQTTYLGQAVLFAERFSSTMDLANDFKNVHGLVVTTNYQTAGLGRNANKWLSPKGCAMFTVNLQWSASCGLFSRISLIQHLASLSIALALPPQVNVRIKWPNDLLFAESMSKLAGILVRSFLHGNTINVQIGFGINLSNRQPSVCLDEIIEHYNSQLAPGMAKLELITKEVLIANILNHLESLFLMLEQGKLKQIKQLYCANWIHSDWNIEVRDTKAGNTRNAVICGIDDNGYLLANDTATGESISLQPDGNRFDLMHNLVVLNS